MADAPARPAPPRLVILGAGAPHRGTLPAALRGDREGTPALDWTLRALGVTAAEAVLVAGYRAGTVRARYPELRVVEHPGWERTGSAASLLVALEALGVRSAGDVAPDGLLVCYADVLLRPEVAIGLRSATAAVAVAWDSRWRARYAGRPRRDLEASEKVQVDGAAVTALGYGLAADAASGEFVGVVRLTPPAVDRLLALADRAGLRTGRAQLSAVVAALVADGLACAGVDVDGDWAELDQPEDIARFVLGTKADTLARLRGTLASGRIADLVTLLVREWDADADGTVRSVRDRLGDVPLIVRSSSSHEDAFAASNAGGFTSVLDVVGDDALRRAVALVIDSYRAGGIPDEDLPGQQVLVQPMIADVALSGVATTRTLEHGAPWRVVAFTEGTDTAAVTAGSEAEQRTLVVARSRAPDAPLPPDAAVVAPLLPVLDEVERLLGHDRLDLEFAIDRRGVVHVLQVRPLVTPLGGAVDDDEVAAAVAEARVAVIARAPLPEHPPLLSLMTDWNPAEMIGTAPGALARSLYGRLITDEVWARQRAEYGYRDVRPAPLLRDVAGRPYVDVRLSLASFLPATLDDGLAARLVGEALDRLRSEPWRHDKVEFGVVATCLAPDFPAHAARLRTAGFDAADVDRLADGLRAITRCAFERVDADLARVRGLEALRDAHAGLPPVERARRLLDDVREHGTLPFAHLARGAFVAVALLRGAVATGDVPDDAVAAFLGGMRTVGHGLAEDAALVAAGTLDRAELVRRWGHLRPGTYDVTSPRYDSDPGRYLDPLVARGAAGPVRAPSDTAWRTAVPAFGAALARLGLVEADEDVERVLAFLRAAVEGREWAKFAFTRNVSDALEALVAAWAPYGLEREHLAELPVDALLDEPGRAAAGRLRDLAEAGEARRRVTRLLQLPPVITDPSDVDAFVLARDVPNFVGSVRVVAATIDPAEVPADPAVLEGRIVLLPSADPGFDWLFGHAIAGLITLYGGANSHMAIRAAEFGLSAAIGVGEQRFRELRTATLVELDPAGRTVRGVA